MDLIDHVLNGGSLQTGVLIATAVIVGMFVLIKGRADVWKSNYEAERERADRISAQFEAARNRLSVLEAAPSVEKLYDVIVEHDKTERETWMQVTGALASITNQLGLITTKLVGEGD